MVGVGGEDGWVVVGIWGVGVWGERVEKGGYVPFESAGESRGWGGCWGLGLGMEDCEFVMMFLVLRGWE